jgi:hypothetical protein
MMHITTPSQDFGATWYVTPPAVRDRIDTIPTIIDQNSKGSFRDILSGALPDFVSILLTGGIY